MNKGITFLQFIAAILFVFICFSCQKEVQQIIPSSGQATDVSLQEAQLWYTTHLSEQVISNTTGRISGTVKRELLWKLAKNFHLANGMLVLSVPIRYETKYSLGNGGITCLLFYKDKGGQMQTQIMKAIAEGVYLKKHNGQISQQNFSGVVMLYDWNENFLNGVQYKAGKVIGELSSAATMKGSRVESVCHEVRTEYYVDVCIGGDCTGQRFDYSDSYYVCSGGGGSSNGISAGDTGDALNGGGGSSGGGSAGGDTDGERRTTIVRDLSERVFIPGQNDPAISLKSFLDCFGTTQSNDYSYAITIYVEEPVPGSGLNASIDANVGHTCIGFTKTDKLNPAHTITQVIGYYPENGAKAVTPPFLPVTSQIHDNGVDTKYTVSISYDVSPEQFQQAIQAASEFSGADYDLAYNNCTDYAFDICNRAGLTIPQNKGELIYTIGHHPGQLGFELRLMKQANPGANININGGYTPASKGPC